MNRFTRTTVLAVTLALVVVTASCGSSDEAADDTTSTDAAAPTTTSSGTTSSEATDTDTDTDTDSPGATDVAVASLFVDGALTADPSVVACTLETGTETTCFQFEVSSLVDSVDTDGPYCPDTVDDVGGIWVWDGEDPGLYALDADFWAKMEAQGYEFVDADGNITVTDPGGGGGAGSGGTANSCLEATADGSFHLQVLIPTQPEVLDEPVELSTISQVGLALDGVTIFGDAPSVADRGGLPALDACGGHIDPSGYYHWHFGAESIQTNLDEAGTGLTCEVDQDVEALLGFSYDGYGIYGPEENGEVPTDLDECSGHVADTDEFGEIYHYHYSYESPNLPGCRVGASATGALTSPDNQAASLLGGDGAGGGPPPGGGG
ncbi:MAG: YHYH protein [Acidimicrobiales bacterium]|nr:YHYH protein [Acidimicrobiales bacterium]